MKRLTAIMIILAVSMGVFAQDWSIPVECPIETSQPADLLELTWSQGSSPLMAFDVTRRGRPIDVDTNTIVRMIIGPSATNDYFVVATNYLATGSTYYVQFPTVGTNTADSVWWYTVYFEVDGYRYWTGNGELCITPTTSTDDGLVWQALTTNAGVISNAADIAINTANIEALTANAVTNEVDPRALRNYHYGDPDISITPTNEFTFNAGTGTITAYSGTNATVVIPYEIGGVDVVAVGDNVFRLNTTLELITIPKSVSSVGNDVFRDCTSLVGVSATGEIAIGGRVFQDCTGLVGIALPLLTTVSDSAFIGCTSIAEIVLESATIISSGSFNGCSGLKSADFPLSASLGSSVFNNCSSITNISITSVGSIGNGAMANCPLLASVEFGKSPPSEGVSIYVNSPNVTNYILNVEAEGWGDTFGGRPVVKPNIDANEGSFKGTVIMLGNLTGSSADFSGAVTSDTAVITSSLLATGTASGNTPTLDAHFATKGYVDGLEPVTSDYASTNQVLENWRGSASNFASLAVTNEATIYFIWE